MKPVMIVLVLVAVFGFVGNHDAQDQALEQQAYCNGVASGQHPDYHGTYQQWCK